MGISYGTDAEQVFLLRHPARVRTMTLLSGSPLNIRLFNFQPGNAQLALDHVFAQCESQPACHQAFPHLAADWTDLWASVGASPWVLPAAQSPSQTTVRLDQDGLASFIYNTMFDGDIGPIPVLVHTLAVARDKAAALASLVNALSASGELSPGPSSGVNQMMIYEIQCNEPWQTVQPGALADQRGSFYYQSALESARLMQFICPLIPESAAAVGQEQPTVSTVPLQLAARAPPRRMPWRPSGACGAGWPLGALVLTIAQVVRCDRCVSESGRAGLRLAVSPSRMQRQPRAPRQPRPIGQDPRRRPRGNNIDGASMLLQPRASESSDSLDRDAARFMFTEVAYGVVGTNVTDSRSMA
jgi:hypothetical protein